MITGLAVDGDHGAQAVLLGTVGPLVGAAVVSDDVDMAANGERELERTTGSTDGSKTAVSSLRECPGTTSKFTVPLRMPPSRRTKTITPVRSTTFPHGHAD